MQIVVVRDEANGDVLLTTPLLRVLKKKHPLSFITFWVKSVCADALRANPHIDCLKYIDKPGQVKKVRADLYIDLRDKDNSVVPGVTPLKTILAVNHPLLNSTKKSRIERSKSGKCFAQLYVELAGFDWDECEHNNVLEVDKTQVDNWKKKIGTDKFVCVALDSCWTSKAYPQDLSQKLIDLIDLPVVLIGRNTCYRNIKCHKNLVGATTITDIVHIIAASSFFIGIDSLPLHIADTIGIRSVSIWTSTGPQQTILTNGELDTPIETDRDCKMCYQTKRCSVSCFPKPKEIVEKMKQPVVHIVMPCYNLPDMTRKAVQSLSTNSNQPFKLVLVDDGGTLKNAKKLDETGKICDALVIHKQNGGFVSACNHGISEALNMADISKDYIMLLNNDIVVRDRDWLVKLVKGSNFNYVVGVMGSMLNDRFNHAGYSSDSSKIHYIDGWCLMAPAKYFMTDDVGSLDHNIESFSEDADWCIRAQKKGIELKIVKNVNITHLHHQTFKMLQESDPHIQSLNYMREKWGTLKEALKKTWVIEKDEKFSRCCLCGSDHKNVTKKGRVGVFDIVVCNECGVQRVLNPASNKDLEKHYDNAKSVRCSKQWIINAENLHKRNWIEFDKYDLRLMQRRGNFLDVGCNWGAMVEIAKNNAWNAMGTEFSDVFVREAKKRGLNVIHAPNLDVELRPGFNYITILDVIEHVKKPDALLKRAYDLLSETGVLVITTPDHASSTATKLGLKWEHIRPLEHIWHFTSNDINRLVEKAGFFVDKEFESEWNFPGCQMFFCRKKGVK